MSNSYYTHTGYPSARSAGNSAALRAELAAIMAGFDKLPALAGNAGRLLMVNQAASALDLVPSLSVDAAGNAAFAANVTVFGRMLGRVGAFDTRAVSDAPSSLYLAGMRLDFKQTATVSNPPTSGGNGYATVLSVHGWSDASGGEPVQISFGDGLAVRRATGAATWGPWRKLWHDGEFNPDTKANVSALASYLPLSGGNLTGALTVLGSQVWHAGNFDPNTYLPKTGGSVSGAVSVGGYLGITQTSGIQRLLMGNQDSQGANKPSILQAANGTFGIGRGDSWAGSGGTFTSWATLSDASANFTVPLQQSGNQVWHAGNFDPSTKANTTALASYLPLTGGTIGGTLTAISSGAMANSGGGLSRLEVKSASGTEAAFLTLHRPGAYATYFGLDTDNKLKVGGWSMGGVAHEIWHAGNTVTPFCYATFTADANTLAANRSSFSYAVNAPFVGPLVHFDANGYGLQISAGYSADGYQIGYRTRNGDFGTWNSWRSLIHSAGDQAISGHLTVSEMSTGGWFRNSSNAGLYSVPHGNHFYSGSSSYWSVCTSNSSPGGLVFRRGHEGAPKGYVYWDSYGFGLLNDQGGWAVRCLNGAVGGELYGTWAAGNLNVSSDHQVYGQTYLRGSVWTLNAAANGWNQTISRNGGAPIIDASNYTVWQDGRMTFSGNSTWGGSLVLGGNGVNAIPRTDLIASVVTTNGNLHLDSGSSRAVILNYYSGTGGVLFGNGATGNVGSVDSAGNAAFNGRMNAVRFVAGSTNDGGVANSFYADGWFRSYGNSGWYSETYGGGIHMLDSTWVRTYNGKGFLIQSGIASYGMLNLVGNGSGGQEVSMNFRDGNQTQDQGWTVGRYSNRFFFYSAGAHRFSISNAGDSISRGRVFGNQGNHDAPVGNGLGAITVSQAGPSGGAKGDVWAVY